MDDVLNALTVDVEDYFHVTAFARTISQDHWDRYPARVDRNTRRLLEIFANESVQATFFVLGWVAQRFPKLVQEIIRAGHRIGCHGYAHQVIYKGSHADFTRDVSRAKSLLEDLSGAAVKSYRAPSYSITATTLWALEILGEQGFEYDSSIFPIVHDQYGILSAPRFPHLEILQNGCRIKEFPPSTVRVLGINFPVGGGGYLRLAPLSVTSWAIRRINQIEQQPAMVYLHPWEIDPDQPRIPAAWRSRFRHYQNLASTEDKVKSLLRQFFFGPMEDVLSRRDLDEHSVQNAMS
jgi:polysaccharide deacetylase family protein (PEP-CTERM system associated)